VAATTEGGTPLVAIDNLGFAADRLVGPQTRFIEVTPPGTAGVDVTSATALSGDALILRTIARDDTLGLNLLESTTSPATNGATSVPLATNPPRAGANVFILGKSPVAVQVGISVTANNAIFVPLSDMVTSLEGKDVSALPNGLPVVNARNELVGLLVHRMGTIGFIPSATIENFVTRLG
jgi:hypothetical protein